MRHSTNITLAEYQALTVTRRSPEEKHPERYIYVVKLQGENGSSLDLTPNRFLTLYLTDAAIERLKAGECVPLSGPEETLTPYGRDQLRFIVLGSDGTWAEAWMHLPMPILEGAIATAKAALAGPWGEAQVTYAIPENVKAYYTPNLTVEWSPEAEAVFERMAHMPAGDDFTTLRDLVERRIEAAKRLSKNQDEAVRLCFFVENGEDSLGFVECPPPGKGYGMRGGIVLKDGVYSTHT